jgi:tetratricopeptide (TPR) repeat protein
MISTPEPARAGRPRLGWLLAAAAGALGLVGAAYPRTPPAGPEALIADAGRDLSRNAGVAAEVRLRQALSAGATREDVAALMGEALLDQGQSDKAGDWLRSQMFSQETAARGFRALGRLDQNQGDLAAAGKAFDRAIALTPNDPTMWVEIGHLRYAGGEHVLALEAANYALKLDPDNVAALAFRGEIVRDQYGLAAALPWFEAALARSPDDVAVLGEYAATLGELGRAHDMLKATRRMLALDPGNPRAFYLQAVLAARADDTGLARALLDRTGDRLADLPGAMLLDGVLQIRAGNYVLALQPLEKLLQLQPENARAQLLLARAMFLDGEYRQVAERFSEPAGRPDASAYLLTLVGRAWENLGRRDLAAPLLDRAAFVGRPPLTPSGDDSEIGRLVASGDLAEAEAIAERARAANPGLYDNQVLAGDVQLAMGDGGAALERYRLASRIRMPASLMLRTAEAYRMTGEKQEEARLVNQYLANNPTSQAALRLAAQAAVEAGDWRRARLLLENLRANGAGRDVQLLATLSLAQLRCGDAGAAATTGEEAYRLQRASGIAARAWGVSLAALGTDPATAAALLAKAQRILGDDPLLAEGRSRVAASLRG